MRCTGRPAIDCPTGAVVVLTGVTDYVSDGEFVARLSNGHPLLGEITGSGCMVGTSVATFCGGASMDAESKRQPDASDDARLARGDIFVAAIAGYVFRSPSTSHLPSFHLPGGTADAAFASVLTLRDGFLECLPSPSPRNSLRRGLMSSEVGRSYLRSLTS